MQERSVFSVGSGEEKQRTRPFYPKRSHKKSRKGCVNCKTRKVKCDEDVPSCRACAARQDTCVYARPATPRSKPQRKITFVHSSYKPAPSSVSLCSPSQSLARRCEQRGLSLSPVQASCTLGMLPPSETFNDVDMKLIWNYTVKTASSLVADEDVQCLAANIFRTDVPTLAFDAPFLMDSILALSCMDLQSMDRRFSLDLAYKYHARAIEGYNRAIREARPETLRAMVVNAILLCIMTTQCFRDPNVKDLYIVDWLFVWRGIGSIVDMVGYDVISRSTLGPILYRTPMNLETSALAVPANLRGMVNSIPETDEDYPSISAYNTVLDILGSLYRNLNLGFGPDLDYQIVTWLSFMPRGFAILAQKHRPRALIILAHYACFFRLFLGRRWWSKGVAERTISDILTHLAGTHWMPWLHVPATVMGMTDPTSIARVILDNPTWVSPERNSNEVRHQFLYIEEDDPIDASLHLLRKEQEKLHKLEEQIDAQISQQMSKVSLR